MSAVKSTPGSVSSKSLMSKNSAFGRIERAKVHQVTVATGLDWNADPGHAHQVRRHDRCCTSQEGERGNRHALIADRQQFGDARTVRFGQNGHGITLVGHGVVGVLVARRLQAEGLARAVTFSPRLKSALVGLHLTQPMFTLAAASLAVLEIALHCLTIMTMQTSRNSNRLARLETLSHLGQVQFPFRCGLRRFDLTRHSATRTTIRARRASASRATACGSYFLQ